MKKITFLLFSLLLISKTSSASESDSLLIGKWELFKIIDNMTGNEIVPVAPNADFKFYIVFEDSLVDFNLEINKCGNSYAITGEHQIKFLYYDECTKICCDQYFSTLLTYESCTGYYVRNNNTTLVLVGEDRIFYFSRALE